MDKKQKELAKKFGVTEATVSYLASGKRYTKNVGLAVALAKLKGTKAIDYINPAYRAVYMRAYQRLRKGK